MKEFVLGISTFSGQGDPGFNFIFLFLFVWLATGPVKKEMTDEYHCYTFVASYFRDNEQSSLTEVRS